LTIREKDEEIARLGGVLLLGAQRPIPIDGFIQDLDDLVRRQYGDARVLGGGVGIRRSTKRAAHSEGGEQNEEEEAKHAESYRKSPGWISAPPPRARPRGGTGGWPAITPPALPGPGGQHPRHKFR